MIELSFTCDGACGSSAEARSGTHKPPDWLLVYPPGTGQPTLHFCGWDCVRSYILHHEENHANRQ